MFYPVDSLKRGGRFYLCWVADSWPLRFASITHRQLWSQDVRKICDDLQHVMMNESGRPKNRFSLRLSSQLMRGLVRLYQRKVTVLLSDLCMINANVTKQTNKKYIIPEESELQRPSRPQAQLTEQLLPQITLPEEPEEQRIEEIIQISGNVVSNIQDITLKEATIPEFQLPNDGFGEEHAEQALQMLGERTVEAMMVATDASAQVSGLDLPGLDLTDKSHDRSRLLVERQMERVSERDLTMFRKSTGEDLVPGVDVEQEIPEMPEILTPQKPIPPQEKLPLERNVEMQEPAEAASVEKRTRPTAQIGQDEEIELEELEEPPAKRRTKLRKVIIDRKIKLNTSEYHARIRNPHVELRCKDSSEDIVDSQVPWETYMRRPCHVAGSRLHSTLGLGLNITRLFMRNLGIVSRSPRAERDFQEEIMHRRDRPQTRSMLERIEEAEEPAIERAQPEIEQIDANVTRRKKISYPDITVTDVTFSKDNLPEIDVEKEGDIEELLETLPQKRLSPPEDAPTVSRKKPRSLGYQENIQMAKEVEIPVAVDIEGDKENVPENLQEIPRPKQAAAERSITAMLQDAGLADIQPYQPEVERPVERKSPRLRSGSSETQLGSLDRTKVSLGDSEQTTDSKRFFRDQWGTEGTMVKIMNLMKRKLRPITLRILVSKGPQIAGYTERMIAARCFNSILKLKHHGFLTIKKLPESNDIEDIELGPMFD